MDEIFSWHWWMFAALLFFILEVFTPGFILACLGFGSLVAAMTALMNFNIDAQFISFSVSTLISLFLIRPMLYKKDENHDKIKTNTEALIGRVGSVSETIDNLNKSGRVLIDGDQWKAISHNNEILKLNDNVEVISIDSTIITVKKI